MSYLVVISGNRKQESCILHFRKKYNEKKGCLCVECPMTKMMSLRWNYYCTQGNGMDLSETEKANNIVIPLISDC